MISLIFILSLVCKLFFRFILFLFSLANAGLQLMWACGITAYALRVTSELPVRTHLPTLEGWKAEVETMRFNHLATSPPVIKCITFIDKVPI